MSEKLYAKACKAWERYCELRGYIHQQPNYTLSDMDDKFLYLRNISGDLAHYEIATGKIRIVANG
jgi:hypothetical protein